MSEDEIQTIIEFVRSGGGLHMVCDHTNAYDNATLANRVLTHFDIEAADVLVIDDNARKDSWFSPAAYAEHPVTDGINTLVYQAGCALVTDYGVAFTDANAWADRGDPTNGIARFGDKIMQTEEIIAAMPVAAARDFGKGRVVVTTDCNLYANSWIFAYDHFKLARNAFCWLAQIPPVNVPKTKPSILIHEGTPSYFRVNWNSNAYYAFYVNFGHMDAARAYLSTRLSFDKDAIFLFDRITLSPRIRDRLFDYVSQGGVLVYLCTEKNYEKQRTQILKRFAISFTLTAQPDDDPYISVTGEQALCRDVFQLPAIPSAKIIGAQPVVYGEADPDKVFVARKQVGSGAVYLIPGKSIFKTQYMGQSTSSRNSQLRQQQVRRLQENLISEIVTNY